MHLSQHRYWKGHLAQLLAIFEIQYGRIRLHLIRKLWILRVLQDLVKLTLQIHLLRKHLHTQLIFVHLCIVNHVDIGLRL